MPYVKQLVLLIPVALAAVSPYVDQCFCNKASSTDWDHIFIQTGDDLQGVQNFCMK